MDRTSLTLIFTFSLIICFGQSEIKGTWTLDSYTIDSGKVVEIRDKLKKDKLTFYNDGRYVKTYYAPKLPDGARHQVTYSLLDGKITDKYFDKDGHELKMVQARKRTESGTFKMSEPAGEIQFLMDKNSYSMIFKVEGQYLIIADTLDNRVVWGRYKKKT